MFARLVDGRQGRRLPQRELHHCGQALAWLATGTEAATARILVEEAEVVAAVHWSVLEQSGEALKVEEPARWLARLLED